MEPLGNLWVNRKRLQIKQTSYCVLAQSKSKGPTINKKKKSFMLCLSKEFRETFVSTYVFKSSCPSSKFLSCFFCFLYLPVSPVSSNIHFFVCKLSCVYRQSCVSSCVQRFLSLYGREIWETVRLRATEWIWVWALWLIPPLAFAHTRTHTRSLSTFPIQVGSCDGGC